MKTYPALFYGIIVEASVVRETAGKAEGTEPLCFLSGTHRSISGFIMLGTAVPSSLHSGVVVLS